MPADQKPVVDRTRKKLRNAGFGYSGAMVFMVIVLVVTMLAAPRSAPPAIAEIAPQAVEQIKEAPPEQATKFGSGDTGTGGDEGDGGSGGGGAATTTTIPPEGEEEFKIPSIRKCVGNPPRQIEDPQSPPCVAAWRGDNGGATWKGVTRDTIRIGVPGGGSSNIQPLEDFFNRRFEFYGRKIDLVDTDSLGGGDPQSQINAATTADEQYKVFASMPAGTAEVEYMFELARRQLIGVASRPTFTTKELTDHAPYIWQYAMALDRIFSSLGEWSCNRLVPGKARHAGTSDATDLKQVDRKFGLVLYSESTKQPIDPTPLEQELKACGVEIAETVDIGSNFTFGEWAVTAALALKDAGVTSVFCLCNVTPWGAVASAASSQRYFPEWMVSTYILTDSNFYVRPYVPAEQREHSFGITQQPRQIPWANEPAAWAFKEQSPGYDPSSTDSSSAYGINIQYYRPLLLLASGIQMAGPKLTPETFERGLQAARFPNPEHPNRPGKVGFQGGSHAMMLDSAEYWWDNEAQGPYPDDNGAWCYVDNGERLTTGRWKKGDEALFKPPCLSGRDG